MCNVVISPVFFAGYYCNGSTILSNPPDGSTGGGCPLGHYCPTGTSVPNACPMGYYLDMILSSVASACKICKLGEYQRILSLFLKNLSCFILNFHGDKWCGLRLNNWLCRFWSCGPLMRELDKPFYDLWWNYELMVKDKQQTLWINYVLNYLSGMYCGSEGLADVTGPCDPGYYCPAGQVSATPANYSCQPGYFCVGGKSAPESCPSGSYQVRARFATGC